MSSEKQSKKHKAESEDIIVTKRQRTSTIEESKSESKGESKSESKSEAKCEKQEPTSTLVSSHRKKREATRIEWASPLITDVLYDTSYRQKMILFDDSKLQISVEWVTNQHEEESGNVTEQMENFVRISCSYPSSKEMDAEEKKIDTWQQVLLLRFGTEEPRVHQLNDLLSAVRTKETSQVSSQLLRYGWGSERMSRLEFLVASPTDPDFDGECESRCLFSKSEPFGNVEVVSFLAQLLVLFDYKL